MYLMTDVLLLENILTEELKFLMKWKEWRLSWDRIVQLLKVLHLFLEMITH